MLPTSHPAPIQAQLGAGVGLLAEAAAVHAHLNPGMRTDPPTASLRADLAASQAALRASLAESDRLRARLAVGQTMLATLAHEIRNPLASLELFTTLLQEEPARSGEWLIQLRAGLRGLGATVSNVLAFQGDGESARLEPVTLSRIVAAAVEFARPLIVQGGLDLHVHGSTMPGTVQASPALLQQLLLNLIVNAVRHTPAPGKVMVTIAQAGGSHLRLTVRDTGSGIAPEHLPHLFTPGWSASSSTGLGLAIAQRIAAQHGTVLQVQSTLGEGAAFSMELKTMEFKTR